jgi:hypothetical protein
VEIELLNDENENHVTMGRCLIDGKVITLAMPMRVHHQHIAYRTAIIIVHYEYQEEMQMVFINIIYYASRQMHEIRTMTVLHIIRLFEQTQLFVEFDLCIVLYIIKMEVIIIVVQIQCLVVTLAYLTLAVITQAVIIQHSMLVHEVLQSTKRLLHGNVVMEERNWIVVYL